MSQAPRERVPRCRVAVVIGVTKHVLYAHGGLLPPHPPSDLVAKVSQVAMETSQRDAAWTAANPK